MVGLFFSFVRCFCFEAGRGEGGGGQEAVSYCATGAVLFLVVYGAKNDCCCSGGCLFRSSERKPCCPWRLFFSVSFMCFHHCLVDDVGVLVVYVHAAAVRCRQTRDFGALR